MKNTNFFLMFAALISFSFLVISSIQINDKDLNVKAQQLIQYGSQLEELKYSGISDSIMHYEKLFFYNFPNSFNEFIRLYGYNSYREGKYHGVAHPDNIGIIESYAVDHVYDLFNNLRYIDELDYINKMINIAVDAYWEADAVNHFQYGIRCCLRRNPNLFIQELQTRSNNEIIGFWFFYFDEPYPSSEIPEFLIFVKEYDQVMFELMKNSLIKVHKKWNKED